MVKLVFLLPDPLKLFFGGAIQKFEKLFLLTSGKISAPPSTPLSTALHGTLYIVSNHHNIIDWPQQVFNFRQTDVAALQKKRARDMISLSHAKVHKQSANLSNYLS